MTNTHGYTSTDSPDTKSSVKDASSWLGDKLADVKADNIRDKISTSAHEVAEDARLSVVKAIETAATKLHHFKNSQNDHVDGYVNKLAVKLDHFAERLGNKDTVEIAEQIIDSAKKYQIPLILGGLALGYMALKTLTDRRD